MPQHSLPQRPYVSSDNISSTPSDATRKIHIESKIEAGTATTEVAADPSPKDMKNGVLLTPWIFKDVESAENYSQNSDKLLIEWPPALCFVSNHSYKSF